MKRDEATDELLAMERNAAEAEAMLKLLANRKRLMILCHLVKEDKTVSALSKSVNLSHSAMSQHLARMRGQGLVSAERRGQEMLYQIASPEVRAILSTLYLIYCRP